MQHTIDHAAFLARPGHDIDLADFDCSFTADFKDKRDAKEKLGGDIKHLSALQDTFYAAQRYALLIIFQGMDAAEGPRAQAAPRGPSRPRVLRSTSD